MKQKQYDLAVARPQERELLGGLDTSPSAQALPRDDDRRGERALARRARMSWTKARSIFKVSMGSTKSLSEE